MQDTWQTCEESAKLPHAMAVSLLIALVLTVTAGLTHTNAWIEHVTRRRSVRERAIDKTPTRQSVL
eukprot:2177158-Rhodomonas_salina.1